jgi:CRP/FNR family transcriptional regulator, anaerobic regulatory protein
MSIKPEQQQIIKKDFVNYLSLFVPLNNIEKEDFLSIGQVVKVKKGTIFIVSNEVSNHFYYIWRGSTRGFYSHNEKEVTSWFAFSNEVITALPSFTQRIPSHDNFETLENSIMLKISYDEIQTFYNKYHRVERIGRLIVERYFAIMAEQLYQQYFLTAQERYKLFMVRFSDNYMSIPLKHIASYLGVTQETLSRLRSSTFNK